MDTKTYRESLALDAPDAHAGPVHHNRIECGYLRRLACSHVPLGLAPVEDGIVAALLGRAGSEVGGIGVRVPDGRRMSTIVQTVSVGGSTVEIRTTPE